MDEHTADNLFYVCCLIEYIVRKTKSNHKAVISFFTRKDIERQLRLAPVNHCLSFEQVSDEVIDAYHIPYGDNHKNFNINQQEFPYPLQVVG